MGYCARKPPSILPNTTSDCNGDPYDDQGIRAIVVANQPAICEAFRAADSHVSHYEKDGYRALGILRLGVARILPFISPDAHPRCTLIIFVLFGLSWLVFYCGLYAAILNNAKCGLA
jgi:hypothetical protein